MLSVIAAWLDGEEMRAGRAGGGTTAKGKTVRGEAERERAGGRGTGERRKGWTGLQGYPYIWLSLFRNIPKYRYPYIGVPMRQAKA